MDKEVIIQKLAEIQKVLETQARLETLPEIEKDIILTRLQEIYTGIKYASLPAVNTPVSENITTQENADTMKQEELLEIESEKPRDDAEKTRVVEKTPTKEVAEELPKSEKNKTLGELYGSKAPLMNEVLAEKMRRKDLSSVLQSKPIDSLEHAIDINAKFLFVRELFFNNVQLFEKTIRILDSAANFNEAFNYIQQQFIWNYESEVVQRFLELVRRRFIKDEHE